MHIETIFQVALIASAGLLVTAAVSRRHSRPLPRLEWAGVAATAVAAAAAMVEYPDQMLVALWLFVLVGGSAAVFLGAAAAVESGLVRLGQAARDRRAPRTHPAPVGKTARPVSGLTSRASTAVRRG